ncbi:hypothetical protein BGW39_006539 [Mortierella sp. 14UC]|nr:hypothetical protein BGW39_006539 [Mortierella sp. 14UC]
MHICSVFVPVPSIVVKSHQTLEAILPYLPLSLTGLDPEENNSGPDPLLPQPSLPAPPESSSNTSSALATTSSPHSTALVLSSRQDIIPSSSSSSPSANRNNNTNTRRSSSSNSNRISPDSSIPATTCIKISLHPTPSFKFVKPKCPHQHQKNRNRRHLQQQHQQQQHSSSSSSSHSHSHSHSQSHSHHHGHNHNHSHPHRSDSHRHNHTHNHSNTATSMASLEYPQQTSTTAAAATAPTAVGGTITIKFTYPVPSANSSTPIPEQVQVTGTFNAWQRSQPLTCNQDRTLFEADIPIDLASLPPQESNNDKKSQEEDGRKKILFKFVLNGQNWVTDPDQPTERDYAGNLNNVLFVSNPLASAATTTTTAADKDEPASPAPLVKEVKVETETDGETEEEKAARLKQEAEDDETIRKLGGGMWGAPFFAVNDPIALPEHFSEADNEGSETVKEVKVAPVAPVTVASKEQEKEVGATVAAVTQEIAAEKVQAEIEADVPAVQSTQSAAVAVESSTLTPEEPKVEAKEEEVEDEDDKIIKALGGGMWGTPFFKVNDPAELPEHFQEALKHNAAAATVSTLQSSSSPAAATAVETEAEEEEVTDKDGGRIQVVKNEIKATVEGGNLIETVVETTEDTVITAADGTFLEESITTTVEDTISGVLEEEVTEVIETIEEEDAPSAAAANESGAQVVVEDEGVIEFVETIQEQTDENDTQIPDAGAVTPPEVTMTETETTISVQGEDGVETTIVEDTLTFTDGPEVDASSLHSLSTTIKPVSEGESVVVEQSPQVLLVASGSGDAKPSVDESVETPLPFLSSTTVDTTATSASEVVEPSTPVPGKVQQTLQDVVLLPQDTIPAGDAKPTADLSVATTPVLTPVAVDVKSTLPTHLAPDAEPTALTAVVPTTMAGKKDDEKTEKSEKRKSFWNKIKKVLS